MNDISTYAQQGEKPCQSNCKREPILTENGPVIVCHFCQRIVRDFTKWS